VIPLIEEITGPEVRTIDPAPAVARQVRRLLAHQNRLNPAEAQGAMQFYTSGDPEALAGLLPRLLGEAGPVRQVSWMGDTELQIQV
jgi:glutamate racemase